MIATTLGIPVAELGFNEKKEGAAIHFAASTRFLDGDPCDLIRSRSDEMLVVLMAGSVAEKVLLGEILEHGYKGDLGAIELCHPDLPADPKPLLDEAMRRAMELTMQHRDEIEAVADQLLIADHLLGSDVEALMEGVQTSSSSEECI